MNPSLSLIILILYLYPTAFLAGFIICDVSSSSNINYSPVIYSFIWPFFFFIALYHYIRD